MSKPFQFKLFTVQQDRCAMKIGTDGVLLGAWTSIDNNPFSVLDIGTGTGVIALQLAQRSNAKNIEALEIDEDAYEQCVENFENSPWGDRLFCYHAALDEFTEEFSDDEAEIDDKFDLIVSNPPFYSEDYKTQNEARDIARFSEAMPFEHLIDSASKLLAKKGTFATIIPRKEEGNFIQLASEKGLFPLRICRVCGNETSEEVRSLLEFSFSETTPIQEKLVIEISRHQYTEAYKKLVQDFYLKM